MIPRIRHRPPDGFDAFGWPEIVMRLSRALFRSVIRPDPVSRLLARHWFAAALGMYLLLAIALRLLLARSLMFDESEQLAHSQILALGYSSQPPLIVWLTWLAVKVFGVSVATVLAVRFGVLGLMFAGLYACGRALTATHERAALAAASALLLPAVCWDFMLDKTHTPMACAMAAFTVAALVRAVRSGGFSWVVAVGVCAGLGVLSKYTFVPFAVGLAVASLTVPAYRNWLLSRRGLLAALTTIGIVLPHAFWAIANHAELRGGISRSLTEARELSPWTLPLSAVDVVITSCGITLLAFGVFAPRVFRRSADSAAEASVLGRGLLVAAFLAAAIVLVSGGNRLKVYWFTPLAVLFPVFLVSRLGTLSLPRWRVVGLWVSACVMFGSWSAVAVLAVTTDTLRQGRLIRARDQLAADVAALLKEQPDGIVCDSLRDAGNVKLACPRSVVGVLGTPSAARPELRGSVVFVWEASKRDDIHEDTLGALAREFGLHPDPAAPHSFVGDRHTHASPNARRVGVIRLIPIGDGGPMVSH